MRKLPSLPAYRMGKVLKLFISLVINVIYRRFCSDIIQVHMPEIDCYDDHTNHRHTANAHPQTLCSFL